MTYILDACALIAFFAKEDGAENINDILKQAIEDETTKVLMSKINLLEVYYDVMKKYTEQEADKMLEITGKMPVEVIHELSDTALKKAGYFKAKYRISLADSIALAESAVRNGILITSDHHEFEPIKQNENISIKWYR